MHIIGVREMYKIVKNKQVCYSASYCKYRIMENWRESYCSTEKYCLRKGANITGGGGRTIPELFKENIKWKRDGE